MALAADAIAADAIAADAIAAGDIGCMTPIASGTGTPVLHTVELLDWATGGPRPEGLRMGGWGMVSLSGVVLSGG